MGSRPLTVAVVSPQAIVQHGLVGLLGRHPHRVTVVDVPERHRPRRPALRRAGPAPRRRGPSSSDLVGRPPGRDPGGQPGPAPRARGPGPGRRGRTASSRSARPRTSCSRRSRPRRAARSADAQAARPGAQVGPHRAGDRGAHADRPGPHQPGDRRGRSSSAPTRSRPTSAPPTARSARPAGPRRSAGRSATASRPTGTRAPPDLVPGFLQGSGIPAPPTPVRPPGREENDVRRVRGRAHDRRPRLRA